jgi:site-specific recombinase XerD
MTIESPARSRCRAKKASEDDVEDFMRAKRREGKSPKSIRNWLSLLHSIFVYSEKKRWAQSNPVKSVGKPRTDEDDVDVRFLDQDEVELLIAATPDDDLGRLEAVLYLTAVMTGMRQGELIGLRWLDVDWPAQRIRRPSKLCSGRIWAAEVQARKSCSTPRRSPGGRARAARPPPSKAMTSSFSPIPTRVNRWTARSS